MLKMEEEQDGEDRVSMQLSTVELTVMSPNMLPEQVTLCVCRDHSCCHVMSPNMLSEQVTLCV